MSVVRLKPKQQAHKKSVGTKTLGWRVQRRGEGSEGGPPMGGSLPFSTVLQKWDRLFRGARAGERKLGSDLGKQPERHGGGLWRPGATLAQKDGGHLGSACLAFGWRCAIGWMFHAARNGCQGPRRASQVFQRQWALF